MGIPRFIVPKDEDSTPPHRTADRAPQTVIPRQTGTIGPIPLRRQETIIESETSEDEDRNEERSEASQGSEQNMNPRMLQYPSNMRSILAQMNIGGRNIRRPLSQIPDHALYPASYQVLQRMGYGGRWAGTSENLTASDEPYDSSERSRSSSVSDSTLHNSSSSSETQQGLSVELLPSPVESFAVQHPYGIVEDPAWPTLRSRPDGMFPRNPLESWVVDWTEPDLPPRDASSLQLPLRRRRNPLPLPDTRDYIRGLRDDPPRDGDDDPRYIAPSVQDYLDAAGDYTPRDTSPDLSEETSPAIAQTDSASDGSPPSSEVERPDVKEDKSED